MTLSNVHNHCVTKRPIVWLVCLLVCLVVILAPAFGSGPALAESAWTRPIVVYSTTGFLIDPLLISDTTGDVHLFVASDDADPGARRQFVSGSLVYMRLHNGRWSSPVEVLTSPGGDAPTQPAVSLDSNGFLHVVWRTPSGQLLYSHAYVSQAGSPAAWSAPISLTDGELSPGPFGMAADIVVSPSGGISVAYAQTDGNIYLRQSFDGGNMWSTASTIVGQLASNMAADLPRLSTTSDNALLLTWTELTKPNGWPPAGVYYARSGDGGNTWSPSVRMAGSNYGLSAMLTNQSSVYLLWNSVIGIGQRADRQSDDGGRNFGETRIITPPAYRGGFSGFPAIAMDSAGVVHLLTALSKDAGVHSGIYEVALQGQKWSEPTYISQGAVGDRSVEQPSAAISLGNRLHVVYEDDFNRLWYTSELLPTPTIQPQEVPAAPLAPIGAAVETSSSAVPQMTVPPTLEPLASSDPLYTTTPVVNQNPTTPLIASLVAVVMILAGLIAYRVAQSNQ